MAGQPSDIADYPGWNGAGKTERMHARPTLQPEVLDPSISRAAKRRHLLAAGLAASIGGALGGGGAVALALSVPSAQIECIQPSPPSDRPLAIALPIANLEPPAEPTAKQLADREPNVGRAAAVIDADRPRIVLDAHADEKWLAAITPKVVDHGDAESVLEVPVVAAKVPREYRAQVGAPVTLLADDGSLCSGFVGKLSGVRLISDFAGPVDSKQLLDVWGWESPSLVAEIDALGGGCNGELIAAVIGQGDYKSMAVTTLAASKLARQVAAKWRLSAGWGDAQRRFTSSGEKGSWDQARDPEMQIVGGIEAGIAIASRSVGLCGDFEAIVTSAFRIVDGKLGEAVAIPADVFLSVDTAVDSNDDGLPELFYRANYGERRHLRSGTNGYSLEEGAAVTYEGCSC